jgi:arylsulfatase A-like enzyme
MKNWILPSFLMLVFISCEPQEENGPPNIIFFFTDDQAYDTTRAYGNPNTKTPNMDKLANEGVVFMRHYNTTAICMASRANVMTGQFEYKTGCNFTHGPLGTKQWSTSYPLLLKQAGYRIGFGGKFGFSVSDNKDDWKPEGTIAQHDFDFWVGGPGQTSFKTADNQALTHYAEEYPHSSRAYGAASIDFINESVNEKKPFCMSVFYKAPHRPVQPDPMFDDIYKDTEFRKLPNYGRENGEHLAIHSQMGRQYPRFYEWGYDNDKDYQEALRKYNQQIYGVDYSIGMVLNELEKLGIEDNTVIIFSSDNGFFNGSHGMGSKVLPYEESARCPLIIVDPRHQETGKMRKTDILTGNVDIPATILDLAGIEIPTIYDGKSLLSTLDHPESQVRESLPIVQVWGPSATQCLSVLDEQYKYIYWYYKDEEKNLSPTEELFDLQNDPYEMVNLIGDEKYDEVKAKMRILYDQQLEHWKTEGVKKNNYEKYGLLFDRTVSWEDKNVE